MSCSLCTTFHAAGQRCSSCGSSPSVGLLKPGSRTLQDMLRSDTGRTSNADAEAARTNMPVRGDIMQHLVGRALEIGVEQGVLIGPHSYMLDAVAERRSQFERSKLLDALAQRAALRPGMWIRWDAVPDRALVRDHSDQVPGWWHVARKLNGRGMWVGNDRGEWATWDGAWKGWTWELGGPSVQLQEVIAVDIDDAEDDEHTAGKLRALVEEYDRAQAADHKLAIEEYLAQRIAPLFAWAQRERLAEQEAARVTAQLKRSLEEDFLQDVADNGGEDELNDLLDSVAHAHGIDLEKQ